MHLFVVVILCRMFNVCKHFVVTNLAQSTKENETTLTNKRWTTVDYFVTYVYIFVFITFASYYYYWYFLLLMMHSYCCGCCCRCCACFALILICL